MLFAALLSPLAAASPMKARAAPPVSQSTGFTLVANITDTTKNIFDPPVNGWNLVGTHIGAGLSAAVLSNGGSATFFQNGTAQDISSAATSVNLPPIASVNGDGEPYYTPWGLDFFQYDVDSPEYNIGLNFGLPTRGSGIVPGLRSAYAELFFVRSGSFVVCNETAPAYGRPQYPVRFEQEAIPDNCVPIKLLAQCAELPELAGVDALNITVYPVKCYDDVSAIDWSQY